MYDYEQIEIFADGLHEEVRELMGDAIVKYAAGITTDDLIKKTGETLAALGKLPQDFFFSLPEHEQQSLKNQSIEDAINFIRFDFADYKDGTEQPTYTKKQQACMSDYVKAAKIARATGEQKNLKSILDKAINSMLNKTRLGVM